MDTLRQRPRAVGDGGISGAIAYQFVVVYGASAGFVTGGGSIKVHAS
jgi:hypothetical protein